MTFVRTITQSFNRSKILIYGSICLILVSCFGRTAVSEIIPDVITIEVKQNVMTAVDSILLEIKNLTSQPIRVNNPRSTSVLIFDVIAKNGQQATRSMLIHDLKAGKNDFIDVSPNASATVNHIRTLGELL